MAEETPEGYESPRERRERREREREERDRNNQVPPPDDNPNAPLKYDLKAIEGRRIEAGEKIWRAVAEGRLNLSNTGQLERFLSEIGLLDKKEEGRHMRRMFLGALDPEGWGMGDNGYSRALDEYRPNWSRMISGMKKNPTTGLYGTDGGKWYDAFGRLVRTDPITPAPTTPIPTTPTVAPPPQTNTGMPTPGADTAPPVNPAFYGGTTAPNPYGVGGPGTAMTRRQEVYNRRGGRQAPQQAPGWYSTWRF